MKIEMSNELVTSIVKGTGINTANGVLLISIINKKLLEIDVVKSEVCDCFTFVFLFITYILSNLNLLTKYGLYSWIINEEE